MRIYSGFSPFFSLFHILLDFPDFQVIFAKIWDFSIFFRIIHNFSGSIDYFLHFWTVSDKRIAKNPLKITEIWKNIIYRVLLFFFWVFSAFLQQFMIKLSEKFNFCWKLTENQSTSLKNHWKTRENAENPKNCGVMQARSIDNGGGCSNFMDF